MASYYVTGYSPPAGVSDSGAVRAIQQQLNASGAGLKEDGIWGPKTQAAYQGQGGPTAAVQQLTSGMGAFMQGIQSLLSVPKIDYQPQSAPSLQAQLEAGLRPGVDQAIKTRQEQTLKNRAELDADAYARGMGKSTYVTDVKDRQMEYEADDIAAMEGQYSATLAQLLMDAVEKERARALQVQQYNAERQAEVDKLAFSTAQGAYSSYVTSLQQAQEKQTSGTKSAKQAARATSPENCYQYLELLSPKEREAVYAGRTSEDRVVRDELIASLGESGYLRAQGLYPAG